MLSIKLSRIGKKHMPYFRIIVLDKQKDPWGKFLENLGTYNPRTKELKIDGEKVKQYISKGAQPSKTIHNILISEGIIEGKKVRVSRLSKKRQVKLTEKAKEKAEKKAAKEEAPKEEAPKEEAPKEEAPKEEAPKEEAPKEEAPKEEAPKEEAPKEEAPKEEAPKEEEKK